MRDNLGEPQQLGFGLDLKGFQTTIEFVDMQAHSLKPTGGTDMQFSLVDNLIMGLGVRLSSYLNHNHLTLSQFQDAAGHCVAARSMDPGSPVDCPPCDPLDPLQTWVLDGHAGEEGTLVLEANPKLCLVVGEDMIEAGPFVKRDLYMEMCQVVQQQFRTWDVVKSKVLVKFNKN